MSISFTFSMVSLFYSILLTIMFFSKERLSSIENKIYSWAIIANLFGVVLAIGSYYFISKMDIYPSMNMFVSKLYLVYLLTYITIFTLYILTISYKGTDKISKEKNYKKNFYLLSFIYLFVLLLIFVLPLYFYNENKVIYSYGPSANLMYIVSILYIIIWLINMFKNYKDLKSKKYIPLFFFILIGGVVIVLQKLNPGLLLMTAMETFVTFLMYFTIENPDIKMIEQLVAAKEKAEKYSNDKAIFLFNMSQQIRTPLNNIETLTNQILEEDNQEVIKEKINNIKLSSQKLQYIVNDSLDISTLEAKNLQLVESKYNLKNLIEELSLRVKEEINSDNIKYNVIVSEDLPEKLYGDSIKVKQILNTLVFNAIKHTEKGFVELNINSVIKHDICRLIIKVEDSGCGMKSDMINKLFEKHDIEECSTDQRTLRLDTLKKLINLIGGTIMVQSEVKKGSEFTVILDQKIVENETIENYEKTKELKPKVLIIDDDEANLKNIIKMFDTNSYEIVIAHGGQEALEKLRNNEQFNLIFLDDTLSKLDSKTTFERMNQIVGFKTPVIIMTEMSDKKTSIKYSNEGYAMILLKPLKLKDVDSILTEYIKTNNN